MPKRNGVTQFVAEHLKLENEQIVEAAKENGINYNLQQVSHARWALTYRRKKARLAAKGNTRRGSTKRASALQKWKPATPKTTIAPRAAAHEVKVAQLRRLIFELGFDTTREVFEFFEHAHEQMKSQ